jgi:hypothetical protein
MDWISALDACGHTRKKLKSMAKERTLFKKGRVKNMRLYGSNKAS